MSPERTAQIGDKTIKEYYWAGSYPVYVNSQLSKDTFEQAVAKATAACAPVVEVVAPVQSAGE